MKKRPQLTVNPLLMNIWPIDPWSRQVIREALEKNNIIAEDTPTTMGQPALKFKNEKDYEQALSIIKDIEIED